MQALAAVLTDVDVCGDGSCWAYAALAAFGLVAHATRFGAPACSDGFAIAPLLPTTEDRAADAMLRAAVHDWVTAHGGARVLAGLDDPASLGDPVQRAELQRAVDSANARLDRIRDVLPRMEGGRFKQGQWGGDTEWHAVTALLGCDIFTYAATGGDITGALFSKGSWRVATVADMLVRNVASGLPLVVLEHHGNHWHAQLPVDAGGRVIFRPLGAQQRRFGLSTAQIDAAMDRVALAGWQM